MKLLIKFFIIFLFNFVLKLDAKEFLYILNEPSIKELSEQAETFFKNSDVSIIREPRGVKLRLYFDYEIIECKKINTSILTEIIKIKDFLAKIKNPAIIEVHTEKFSEKEICNLSNWEISTIIADKLESIIISPEMGLTRERIKSVGYGEFLPPKNTSNNGGKHTNRIDIMILCNLDGE